MFSACGGGSSSGNSANGAAVSGNWQFTLAPPSDGSFTGGLQGGFLLQSKDAVTGAAVYSITGANIKPPLTNPCNGGAAAITGTVSGQSVNLAAAAGSQTFTFTGTLSSDGSTMMGTYSSTAGTAQDGTTPCGTAQSSLQWSATLVPPLTGSIQGTFHSTDIFTDQNNQDFVVSGSLTQGQNIGASNATVTGTLTFIDPLTNLSDYPCFSTVSVNGEISGNSVLLQIINTDGATVGQIGQPASLVASTDVYPVNFVSTAGGYVLQGPQAPLEPSYLVASSSCPGNLAGKSTAGDYGNICLALNNTTACQQPITLTPAAIVFPAQTLGSPASAQTVALANNTGSALNKLTLSFANFSDSPLFGSNEITDFNGLPNFTETDTCGTGGAPSQGQPFDLASGQSCVITVSFSPQESCPWLPFPAPPSISGAPPEWCPFPLAASLTVNSPVTPDQDNAFSVPITGTGVSAMQPSTHELDFGAEALGETSLPQTLTFTNNGANPVQILGRYPCVNPQNLAGPLTLPYLRTFSSPVAGLQVVSNGTGGTFNINPDLGTTPATLQYRCDSDPQTRLPNLQISADTCTGTNLAPQQSCSLQIAFVPQPDTNIGSFGLDFYLELNTVECSSLDGITSDCEIDSGRFPVELKTNGISSLRMSPSAGLDFGSQKKGTTSSPLTITLLNDPGLSQTITFTGKFSVSGNYAETDDCTTVLAPGASCTLTITFKPGGTGFQSGQIALIYSPEPSGSFEQFIYLRGTGQ